MAEIEPDDWAARFADHLAAAVNRRQRARETRHELAGRRTAGKTARHHQRLQENEMVTRPSGTAPRTTGKNHLGPVDVTKLVRCRYTRLDDEMCSAEALDPLADVLICQKHAARVMTLIRERTVGGR